MVQHLTCRCLNVHIHINENSFTALGFKEKNEWFPHLADDSFFQALAPVTLALGGISKEHPYLCSDRNYGQWIVNKCVICCLDTHAVRCISQNQSHILVNVNMEKEPTEILALKQSDKYSSVFRVILDETPTDNRNILLVRNNQQVLNSERPAVNGSRDTPHLGRSVLVDAASGLQNRVSVFFKEEQSAMEERIRTFTEQEHSRFAALQMQVNREKDALLGCLKKIECNGKATSTTTANESNEKNDANDLGLLMGYPAQVYKDSIGKRDEQGQNQNELSTIHDVIHDERASQRAFNGSKSTTRAESPGISKVEARRDGVANNDDDSFIFGIDDIHGNEDSCEDRAFEASDESGNSSDEAPVQNSTNRQFGMNMRQYAISLPISVPHWSPANHAKDADEERQREVVQNMEKLAESFQACRTNSILDGTELFGDLPRHRLRTVDLVKL